MSVKIHREDLLRRAASNIDNTGIRVTDKRTKLLALLMSVELPMSAYEILDQFNRTYDEHLVANSVYRILDCLVKWKLVHRLSTINKYIACSSSNCRVANYYSIFIICTKCQKTHESPASNLLLNELNRSVGASQFGGAFSQIELKGVCQDCRGTQAE